MLRLNNPDEKRKMMNYYRTSDMINLMELFPELSPVTDIIIVENIKEFNDNYDYISTFRENRVDTLKGKVFLEKIENSGKINTFYDTLVKVKEKDPDGVLVLFNLDTTPPATKNTHLSPVFTGFFNFQVRFRYDENQFQHFSRYKNRCLF